nr:hypothetical protein [Rhodococcus sp. 14C212]
MRALLESSLDGATLILQGGRPRVVGAGELTDENRALAIVTRDELREQLPKDRDYNDTDLEFHAAALEATVANLGG